MPAKIAYGFYLAVIVSMAFLLTSGGALVIPARSSSLPPPLTTAPTAEASSTAANAAANNSFINAETAAGSVPFWSYRIAAHALGSIENKRATNSLDAMDINYGENMRLFETDLILTSDDVLVARHDWLPYLYDMLEQNISRDKMRTPPSYAEFMNLRINKKFQPLDFKTLARILKNHKDIYLITDTKSAKKEDVLKQFNLLVSTAKAIDESILDRIVVQVYSEQMYDYVTQVYPFKNIIYAIYMNNDSQDKIITFCKKKKIDVVAVPTVKVTQQFIDKLNRNNIKTFVHSVNTEEEKNKYKAMGVWGIYSDYLLEY